MNVFTNVCCLVLYWASIVTAQTILNSNGLPNTNEFLTMSQKLNNYIFSKTTTKWKQRYVINDEHYDKSENALIFLIVGGQEKIRIEDVQSGIYFQYAKHFKALLICVEHRFYGSSDHPITDDLSTANLSYLNSEQALTDFAMFIAKMKHTYKEGIPSKAKWIAFGAGHAGTLAVRLRLKFPHLVDAGVSSSSRFLELPEFTEFYTYLSTVYGIVTPVIRKAYSELFLVVLNKIEKAKLKVKFNLCDELNAEKFGEDEEFLLWTISNLLGQVLEHGNFVIKDRDEIKRVVRNTMMDNTHIPNELDRLANAVQYILTKSMEFTFLTTNNSNNQICLLSNYKKAVKMYQKSSWDAITQLNIQLIMGLGDRQSFFQKCTEFGQFETSKNISLIYDDVKLKFYTKLCRDVFGDAFGLDALDKGVARSIMLYGGLNIQVTRAIFVNGGRDPFSNLGITHIEKRKIRKKHQADNSVAIYDTKGYYKGDMEIKPDNPVFNDTQNKIISILKEWLNLT